MSRKRKISEHILQSNFLDVARLYAENKHKEEFDRGVKVVKIRRRGEKWRTKGEIYYITHIKKGVWKALCGHHLDIGSRVYTGNMKLYEFIENAISDYLSGKRGETTHFCYSCARRAIAEVLSGHEGVIREAYSDISGSNVKRS